jgi:hypothetical protein
MSSDIYFNKIEMDIIKVLKKFLKVFKWNAFLNYMLYIAIFNFIFDILT